MFAAAVSWGHCCTGNSVWLKVTYCYAYFFTYWLTIKGSVFVKTYHCYRFLFCMITGTYYVKCTVTRFTIVSNVLPRKSNNLLVRSKCELFGTRRFKNHVREKKKKKNAREVIHSNEFECTSCEQRSKLTFCFVCQLLRRYQRNQGRRVFGCCTYRI